MTNTLAASVCNAPTPYKKSQYATKEDWESREICGADQVEEGVQNAPPLTNAQLMIN